MVLAMSHARFLTYRLPERGRQPAPAYEVCRGLLAAAFWSRHLSQTIRVFPQDRRGSPLRDACGRHWRGVSVGLWSRNAATDIVLRGNDGPRSGAQSAKQGG